MRSRRCTLSLVMGIGVALAGGVDAALAQEGGYAPPPPPPPPPPAADTASPAPAPPGTAAQPAPPRRRRPRYRPSPWGRFYLGAGGGYLIPGGELGDQFQSGGAYGAWAGWRKRWIGFEVGYLGSNLTQDLPDRVTLTVDGIPQASEGSTLTASASTARLSHLTGDVKVFLRLFCSSTLFARLGANYTELALANGARYTGYGYQYGAGLDYRIRLGYRPDLILKLRAEVLHVQADLAVGDSGDRRSLSGLYMMVLVNLGWSPR